MVQIPLGRAHLGVAQQFAHGDEVPTLPKGGGRIGVAKDVGRASARADDASLCQGVSNDADDGRRAGKPKMKAATAEVVDEGQPAPGTLGPWKPTGRAVLSMKEAAYVLNIGLTFLGELVKNGNLPVLRLGKRTLVPVTAIEALLKLAS